MKIEIMRRPVSGMEKKVWQFSRPADRSTSAASIGKIDAPVNDFPDFVLAIESTILEREVIASLRDIVMWAQSSRVEDPTKFEIDEQYNSPDIRHIRNEMAKAKAAGVRQDDYRLLLPILSTTRYAIKISSRSLIKLYKYFLRFSAFDDASRVVFGVLQDADLHHNIDSMTAIDILHDVRSLQSGRVGDMITVCDNVPFSLRTHIIRHRLLSVRDNLIDMITDGSYAKMSIRDEMTVSVSADTTIWRDIYSKRSCWLAQYSLWSGILNQVSQHMDLSEDDLPCSGGVCPYVADNVLRMEGKDPNAVCPLYARMNQVDVGLAMKDRMRMQVNEDRRLPFWLYVINEDII